MKGAAWAVLRGGSDLPADRDLSGAGQRRLADVEQSARSMSNARRQQHPQAVPKRSMAALPALAQAALNTLPQAMSMKAKPVGQFFNVARLLKS
jgi:hypothetical protein